MPMARRFGPKSCIDRSRAAVPEPGVVSVLQPELSVALRAAALAAEMITHRHGAELVREKGPGDLVTVVDEAAERAIIGCIQEQFPGDAIIAEESAARTRSSGRRWIIDPIDGTTNFVHGHPFVAVSICFADEQGPALGVVHAPLLGEVFHAVRGAGAYLNDRRLQVSATVLARQALLATGFPFKAGKGDPHEYLRLVLEVVQGASGLRRAGSAALDLAFVAAGRLDAYFEIGLGPWDMAAGMLLVTEAGGTVTGWPHDEELPLATGRILASNSALHPWLTDVVERHVGPL